MAGYAPVGAENYKYQSSPLDYGGRSDKDMYDLLMANIGKWNESVKTGGENAGQKALPAYTPKMDVGGIWQQNLSDWQEEQRQAELARQAERQSAYRVPQAPQKQPKNNWFDEEQGRWFTEWDDGTTSYSDQPGSYTSSDTEGFVTNPEYLYSAPASGGASAETTPSAPPSPPSAPNANVSELPEDKKLRMQKLMMGLAGAGAVSGLQKWLTTPGLQNRSPELAKWLSNNVASGERNPLGKVLPMESRWFTGSNTATPSPEVALGNVNTKQDAGAQLVDRFQQILEQKRQAPQVDHVIEGVIGKQTPVLQDKRLLEILRANKFFTPEEVRASLAKVKGNAGATKALLNKLGLVGKTATRALGAVDPSLIYQASQSQGNTLNERIMDMMRKNGWLGDDNG